jgi:hypothetical protein
MHEYSIQQEIVLTIRNKHSFARWWATRRPLLAMATPEQNINSVYIILIEKLPLRKEFLNEKELPKFITTLFNY